MGGIIKRFRSKPETPVVQPKPVVAGPEPAAAEAEPAVPVERAEPESDGSETS